MSFKAGKMVTRSRPLRDTEHNSARTSDRVVAFARQNGQALTAHSNFDSVIVLCPIIAPRIVAERVLIASLLGHARIQTFQSIALGGIKDVAAGIMSIGLQAGEFAFVKSAANAQTVDGNAIAEQFFHR